MDLLTLRVAWGLRLRWLNGVTVILVARPVAILDLIRVILDRSRSAIIGLSLFLKFCLSWICSFGDIAIFLLWRS